MKKIIIALMLCTSLVVTMLTACGGKENNNPEADNNAVEQLEGKDEAEQSVETETEAEIEEKTDVEEVKDEVNVEAPKLAEDIAVNPEKAEEVVNTLEFDSASILSGVANALGKTTSEMTEEDLNSIYYFSIDTEATGDYTVYIGLQEYMNAVNDNLDAVYVQQLLKKSVVELDFENETFSDLARFKNLHEFELYNVPVNDVSFIKELPGLVSGFFRNNGITDVSALAGYNSDNLALLDFTQNDIADWTPLYHIKDIVVVDNGYRIVSNENNERVYAKIGDSKTLADKIVADEAAAEAPAEKTEKKDSIQFVDENGEQADFSNLFD